MKNIFASIITCLMLVLPISALAQVGHIRLKNEVFKEVEIINKKGEKEYKLEPPGLAIPGDEIIYITTFTNISQEEATDIVITNPLPNNSVYKAGSAFGSGTEITYSVDGGKTYATPESLKVKNQDGVVVTASPEDYNAIRWIFKNKLSPGAESTVTFRTVIK